MNNAIDIALTRLKTRIPAEILDLAFSKREVWEANFSIEQMIINKVIRGVVLKDANIFGGKHKEIVLRPEYQEKLQRTIDDGYMNTGQFSLYRIPPEAREGLQIIEVNNLTYRGNYAGYIPNAVGFSGGVNLNTLGLGVIDSHTFASSPPRPNVEVLSGDLVRLSPSQHASVVWVLQCRIAYDQDFTNLNSSALDTFADVCVAAVKMTVYNTLIIPMDKNITLSGQVLGEFKRIIDTYAEADQRYAELIDKLAGAMVLDPSRMQRLLPYLL